MGIQDKYPQKADIVLNDWTAIAQNTIVVSNVVDMSEKSKYTMNIQAALDSTTAHTGTRFIVETSPVKTGNEDWYPHADFVALIGTAATDLIEDNPLAAGSTAIALTAHALTVEGIQLFIEDATLANSEVVREASQTVNEVVILNGTEYAHVVSTAIFNVVMSQSVKLPSEAMRARLVADNTNDDNGSTLNCRVNVSAARNE